MKPSKPFLTISIFNFEIMAMKIWLLDIFTHLIFYASALLNQLMKFGENINTENYIF